jgi:hypothetical protein
VKDEFAHEADGTLGAKKEIRFMAPFLRPYSAHAFAIFRIIAGLLFMSHGMQKLFGLFGGVPAEAPPLSVWSRVD